MDGALNPQAEQAFLEHVAHCAQCSRELHDEQACRSLRTAGRSQSEVCGLASQYLDYALDGATEKLFFSHLATCTQCADDLHDQMQLRALVDALQDAATEGGDARQDVRRCASVALLWNPSEYTEEQLDLIRSALKLGGTSDELGGTSDDGDSESGNGGPTTWKLSDYGKEQLELQQSGYQDLGGEGGEGGSAGGDQSGAGDGGLGGLGGFGGFGESQRPREKFDEERVTAWLPQLHKDGDVAASKGDFDDASRLYLQALSLANVFTRNDPPNTERELVVLCHKLGELVVRYHKLGDVAMSAGKLKEARRRYEEALRMANALTRKDPSNLEWQRDRVILSNKFDALAETNDQKAAAR